jgi:hypothetical protein
MAYLEKRTELSSYFPALQATPKPCIITIARSSSETTLPGYEGDNELTSYTNYPASQLSPPRNTIKYQRQHWRSLQHRRSILLASGFLGLFGLAFLVFFFVYLLPYVYIKTGVLTASPELPSQTSVTVFERLYPRARKSDNMVRSMVYWWDRY